MSKRIDDTIRLFEALLNGGMESIIERAADRQAPLMERLQVEQLQAGERSDGSRIRPQYSPLTVRLKRRKGQPVDRVTLRDSGDFHASVDVEKQGNAYLMQFRDSKTEKLIQKYGENIEGLQPDNIEKVGRAMVPDIQQELRKFLKL